ncbi:MAG TPA: hypothetical protein VLC91_17420 [Spongiibacteraceae bacterium]|nr:hypothetical protein [Spongiibacteraceae bacterium]
MIDINAQGCGWEILVAAAIDRRITMYRRIICPVDGSEISNRGMREAILLEASIRFGAIDEMGRHHPCRPWY